MTKTEAIKKIQNIVGSTADGIIGNDTLTRFQCKYSLSTKAIVAHFFGNVHHESIGFTADTENLNYSAQALLNTFPKYFRNLKEAKEYERKPEKIANKVYGGRMGNKEVGDGWKYRGRGSLQLTGKVNYIAFGNWLNKKGYVNWDVVSNPDLVATVYYWESAIWFFENNGLFNLVSDISDESIEKMCRRINGGIHGLNDRQNKVRYYYSLFK